MHVLLQSVVRLCCRLKVVKNLTSTEWKEGLSCCESEYNSERQIEEVQGHIPIGVSSIAAQLKSRVRQCVSNIGRNLIRAEELSGWDAANFGLDPENIGRGGTSTSVTGSRPEGVNPPAAPAAAIPPLRTLVTSPWPPPHGLALRQSEKSLRTAYCPRDW